jgi:hypothetical protein
MKSAKMDILKMFGMAVDSEGFIVEQGTDHRVLTPGGEEIHINKWAGLMPMPDGGFVFVKNDLPSLKALGGR